MRCLFHCITGGCLLLLCVCSRQVPETSGQLTVFVSIPPQKYFAERLCSGFCEVKTLIPAGASPHTYEPKPSQMAELSKARLYFSVGVEMEKAWLPRLQKINRQLRVVATDSGIEKRRMSARVEDVQDEGNGINGHQGYEHYEEDPHIWLSPALVKHQAAVMARALMTIDTLHRGVYSDRLTAFRREIDSLDERIAAKFDRCNNVKSFLVFHPSWGYFADAFSLRQLAIEVEGREPGIREMGTIVERAKKEECGVILVQPQFSRRIAEKIAAHIGATVAVADPLAENWSENLTAVAEVLCRQ